MYRLVTYSITGSNPLALSGPGGIAVLEGVQAGGVTTVRCHGRVVILGCRWW